MSVLNSLAHRGPLMIIVVLAGMGTTVGFASNDVCHGVKIEVTKARKEAYAPLVVAAMDGQVKPAQVEFSALMESGNWSAAYVSTPVSDDGVMFFEAVAGQKRFRDLWGGWADPSERPELVAWARKLGAPADLANCFAETVTDR
ncbi:hypothetical protein [Chelativorans sp.]|uniref:hypothetical protein n=1 Tax=Chelativorans sp. TaxID=2203393 RepID=UPI002810D469|nr:hypothetical protein [Chelativorans sp.]